MLARVLEQAAADDDVVAAAGEIDAHLPYFANRAHARFSAACARNAASTRSVVSSAEPALLTARSASA